jgi:hypothetical protein
VSRSRIPYAGSDEKPGRPRTPTVSSPEWFQTYDDAMKGWGAREFLREIVNRQLRHDAERGRKRLRRDWGFLNLSDEAAPIIDFDEINNFLCRPAAVSQIGSVEEAAHALRLNYILIAVDPNTPNIEQRLIAEAKKIRKKHRLRLKRSPGRPRSSADTTSPDARKVQQWRDHRIVALHDLRLNGYDPRKQRMQVAALMFPEIKDQSRRGRKLDRAVKLLDEVPATARSIEAMTR